MISLRSVAGVMFAVSLLAACNQNNSANKASQAQPSGTSQMVTGTNAMMGSRPRLRVVCANDITQFCQGEQRIGRCLRQNMQSLDANCRTAVQEVMEAARERRMERMKGNNNGFGGNGNTGAGEGPNNNGYGGSAGSGYSNGAGGNANGPSGNDGDGDQ